MKNWRSVCPFCDEILWEGKAEDYDIEQMEEQAHNHLVKHHSRSRVNRKMRKVFRRKNKL